MNNWTLLSDEATCSYEAQPSCPELEFTSCSSCGLQIFLMEGRWWTVAVFYGRVETPLGTLASRVTCKKSQFWGVHRPDITQGLLKVLTALAELA